MGGFWSLLTCSVALDWAWVESIKCLYGLYLVCQGVLIQWVRLSLNVTFTLNILAVQALYKLFKIMPLFAMADIISVRNPFT